MSRLIRHIEADLEEARQAERAARRRIVALKDELRKAQQEKQKWFDGAQAFLKRKREVKP